MQGISSVDNEDLRSWHVTAVCSTTFCIGKPHHCGDRNQAWGVRKFLVTFLVWVLKLSKSCKRLMPLILGKNRWSSFGICLLSASVPKNVMGFGWFRLFIYDLSKTFKNVLFRGTGEGGRLKWAAPPWKMMFLRCVWNLLSFWAVPYGNFLMEDQQKRRQRRTSRKGDLIFFKLVFEILLFVSFFAFHFSVGKAQYNHAARNQDATSFFPNGSGNHGTKLPRKKTKSKEKKQKEALVMMMTNKDDDLVEEMQIRFVRMLQKQLCKNFWAVREISIFASL